MEASLQKRRDEKLKAEKDKKLLASSLKKMEEMAAMAHQKDVASGSFYGNFGVCLEAGPETNKVKEGGSSAKSEKQSWKQRKEKRKTSDEKGDAEELGIESKKRKVRKQLAPDEGHYTIDDRTYLEGSAYYPIFEEDMPVEIFTGSSTMSAEYRKTKEALELWKMGIIVRCMKGDDDALESTFDISYLKDINDDDETIEKKVPGSRLRLILGSDDLIPKTIEESRLQLMGGEEVINVDDGRVEVDENTGLSTFRTVTVRKVTVSQEVKEERARMRTKRREELEKEQRKAKEIEARKMEEAKHANADDSALGAYDVWGKGGYKGVDINGEVKLDVSDTAKSLSEGKKNVKFKKRMNGKKSTFKNTKKKQNRRTTTADSDDD
eukprot:CAMPEP_0203664826 /NCGR_PEP_ID=MMETSP0090-20130426/2164_1 /ASSEMBLY_ACC=CAM_ASM_001088 /TAXON_ID=426623 /ORGANISM="Chaetoceros affinis, Strain CCMP159" /LENGTH=379 /DNA_ID=CAMNT_0050528201 /DNA_START=151 /DNA_END=1290 /DNA_ORIENTATION=+